VFGSACYGRVHQPADDGGFGHRFSSICSLIATVVVLRKLTPVILPPGRRGGDEAQTDRVGTDPKDIGSSCQPLWLYAHWCRPRRSSHLPAKEIGGQRPAAGR